MINRNVNITINVGMQRSTRSHPSQNLSRRVVDDRSRRCTTGRNIGTHVLIGAVPEAVKQSMELWIGCVAGALEESEFMRLLTQVGFIDVNIEPTRVYQVDDARTFLTGAGLDVDALAPQIEGRFMSAFVRGTKPV